MAMRKSAVMMQKCAFLPARLALLVLRPLENSWLHAVPAAALRAAPVPSHAVQAALFTLVSATRIAYAIEQITK